MAGELEVGRVKGKQSQLDWEKGRPWAMNFKPGQEASLDIKGTCCLTRKDKGGIFGITGQTAGHC